MIQYNNFLIKREQSRAGSRFAECEKSRLKAKLLMTLALLLTAVTGAWATVYDKGEIDVSTLQVGDILKYGVTLVNANNNNDQLLLKDGRYQSSDESSYSDAFMPKIGPDGILSHTNTTTTTYTPISENGEVCKEWIVLERNAAANMGIDYTIVRIGGYKDPNIIDVTPGATAGTWTFTQPGSNVVLTPIYAKTAAFATTGEEPEVKTLLPAAAEGVVAGTTAPLIAEGTGVVAFAGTSTTVTQGQLMYAIGTSATTAPAFDGDAWSTTVPTAENVNEDGAEVPVWYYIKGADAPDGEDASLDNTFDNTDPVCLIVKVRSNKFDLTLKAANANTIEAGKATVTVDGQPATVTDGKIKAVKMDSEVKMTAKAGYKFRKVEVKKDKVVLKIGDVELDITGCTTWDQVITKNSDKIMKNDRGYIHDSNDQYELLKSRVPVNADDTFDPNATDYLWGELMD